MMKTYSSILFLLFIFASFISIAYDPIAVLYPPKTYDEIVYQNISSGLHAEGINYIRSHADTKPISFLSIEYILNGSVFYTRIIGFIYIVLTTYMIWKLTGSNISFLYPLIPIFLGGMTFNTEGIKVLFVIASFFCIRYQGVFIGLASVFNPFSVLYAVVLKGKNLMYFILIGLLFSAILLYLDLFFSYLIGLINYEKLPDMLNIPNWITIIFLVVFFIIGSRNRTMLIWFLPSIIPVFTRLSYAHYYIVPYTMLFVGFLLENRKGDLK